MTAGRFEEALRAFEAEIASSEGQKIPALVNRALALLALRRYEQAFDAFSDVDMASMPQGARALLEMAQMSWLNNKPAEAKELVHQDLGFLEHEKLSYASTPGGLGDGLFGIYVGVRLNDTSTVQRCTKYLARTLEKPRFAQTNVGRIAQYVLGGSRLEPVLEAICGVSSIDDAWQQASERLSIRRSIIVILFYAAVKEIMQGNIITASDLFGRCHALRNPLLEVEWYLSEYEILSVGKV